MKALRCLLALLPLLLPLSAHAEEAAKSTPSAAPAASSNPSASAVANPDLAALQGKWVGLEVGREAQGDNTLTVSGDTIHFQGASKDEWYKGTFTLPAGTTPKQVIATIKDCPAPDFIGKTSNAIYKIEDGKLTLTGHHPGSNTTPKSFEGDETARTFILKKVPLSPSN